jgi:hypothetical protein
MHPTSGTGITVKVAVALTLPSNPAITTVFHCCGLAVPLASRAAKAIGVEAVAAGEVGAED